MMEAHGLIVTFGPIEEEEDDYSGEDWIELKVQKKDGYGEESFQEWMEGQGFSQSEDGTWDTISPTAVISFYKRWLSTCENGQQDIIIEVHKSRPDLEYSIDVTHGYITPSPMISTDTEIESHTIKGSTSLTLDKVPVTGVRATWEGKIFSKDGELLTTPQIFQEGQKVSWGDTAVYGVIRTQFDYSYDQYIVTMSPRQDPVASTVLPEGPEPIVPKPPELYTVEEIQQMHMVEDEPDAGFAEGEAETAFQSTVIVVWAGGVETLDIDFDEEDSECIEMAYENKTVPDDDDDDAPETETCYELHQLRDPCTKALIKEWKETVPCSGD